MENGIDEHRDEEVVGDVATDVVEQKKTQAFRSGRKIIYIFLVLLVMGLLAGIVLSGWPRIRDRTYRSSCVNNLKQWGLVFTMYSNESPEGKFPPVINVDGIWAFDLRTVTPEYVTDPVNLFCPFRSDWIQEFYQAWQQASPDWDKLHKLAAEQYVYFGYAILDEKTFLDFISITDVLPNADIDLEGHKIYRLRKGVEKLLVPDAKTPGAAITSKIPLIFDNPGSTPHTLKGINVLYLDGHVEFVEFGSKYPATQAVWDYFTEKTAAMKE